MARGFQQWYEEEGHKHLSVGMRRKNGWIVAYEQGVKEGGGTIETAPTPQPVMSPAAEAAADVGDIAVGTEGD